MSNSTLVTSMPLLIIAACLHRKIVSDAQRPPEANDVSSPMPGNLAQISRESVLLSFSLAASLFHRMGTQRTFSLLVETLTEDILSTI